VELFSLAVANFKFCINTNQIKAIKKDYFWRYSVHESMADPALARPTPPSPFEFFFPYYFICSLS
jgi:hypothetical protein